MKNKKILLYYLLEFMLTLLIFTTIILLLLKCSIFSKKYILNILDRNNYYQEVYLDINNDYENYLIPSGFDENITKDIFTENDVKKDINKIVDNFYEGKEVKLETNFIKEKLDNNINDYLEKLNVKITDEKSLDLLEQEILNIYTNKIIINKHFIKYNSAFSKLRKIVDIILYILFILDVLLFVIIKWLFKKITLTIPIFTSLMLLLWFYHFVFLKIDIKSILFWNSYISSIIKNIFYDLSNGIKYVIIIGFILEIIKIIIYVIKKPRI